MKLSNHPHKAPTKATVTHLNYSLSGKNLTITTDKTDLYNLHTSETAWITLKRVGCLRSGPDIPRPRDAGSRKGSALKISRVLNRYVSYHESENIFEAIYLFECLKTIREKKRNCYVRTIKDLIKGRTKLTHTIDISFNVVIFSLYATLLT